MKAFVNSHIEKESSEELKLEELTKRYLQNEISLEEYQSRVRILERRLDLRRVASKLRPISVVVEEYIRNY